VSYFDASELLLKDQEIKESAEELAKSKFEEAKARRDNIKSLDKEIDRYHTLNDAIDDLSKATKRASKLKDQAYGKNKLSLMDTELKGIEAQIVAQDKLIT
jgi:hypothetical protein